MQKNIIIGLLVIIIGILSFNQIKTMKEISKKQVVNQALEIKGNANIEFLKVVKLYHDRSALLEKALSSKIFNEATAKDIKVKINFLNEMSLNEQAEVDQFDLIQNEFSNHLATYFNSILTSKDIKQKNEFQTYYKSIEKVEKEINETRKKYYSLTLDFKKIIQENSLTAEFQELPTFKADLLK